MDRHLDQIVMEDSTGVEVLIRAMFDRKQATALRQLQEQNVILIGGK